MNGKRVKNGLVLTGGGARAAYQVGVLRAIAVITKAEENPFRIISGYSAGAINGAWLAGRSENFDQATQNMWNEWAKITSKHVFNTHFLNILWIAFRWIRDRIFGGMKSQHNQIAYLLDTTPLKKLIKKSIDFEGIKNHLAAGKLDTVSVTSVNYHSGHSVSFFSGNKEIPEWKKLNRMSVRTDITAQHIMASSALPIFFPPVRIGDDYYGDGMIRLNAPLGAAIHLGAERLLVIGIRGPSSTSHPSTHKQNGISLGEVAGTILNGLFFDSLDADLDRLQRINRTVSQMSPEEIEQNPDHLRPIKVLNLRPSREVGDLPSCEIKRLPFMLRFLLRGIGLGENKGTDLLSYLAFEPQYLKSLLELGYEDTMQKKEQVLDFFD